MDSNKKKAVLIVLDSAGCGECGDSHLYGDSGANTILHTLRDGAKLHNLRAAGLFNIDTLENPYLPPVETPAFSYGKMSERSAGKDTSAGHFEIAGAPVLSAYKTYPGGIPAEVLKKFTAAISSDILGGGLPASGTEIIRRLGDEHIKTNFPIVYTSSDSVFQIAADEESYGLMRLYYICSQARKILTGEYEVSRVIARPFIKAGDDFVRTENRKDFSVPPPSKTVLSELSESGFDVIGVGKIGDIFSMTGITQSFHTSCNADGIKKLLDLMSTDYNGLIFLNLLDFDMLYGHRRDPCGYLAALEEFDAALPALTAHSDTTIIITADHGCDPTHRGTDHTREYVPILVRDPHAPPLPISTPPSFSFVADLIRSRFFG